MTKKGDIKPLSYIEISRANLIHNVRQFRALAKPDTKIVTVVKANAYGHGLAEVVRILDNHTDYFQVNSIEELATLRIVSKKKTFLLGYVQNTDLSRVIKLSAILSVFSVDQLSEINKVAQLLKTRQEIHVSVDAFLGREGSLLKDLPVLFKKIKTFKNIKLTGIYAHFANIEDTPDFSHARKQITVYGLAVALAKEAGFKNLQTHISATSGLMIYEKEKGIHPLVRIGIGTYGLWPSEHLRKLYKNKNFNLKSVLTWKTKVAQVKILPSGATIGYGLTYRTKKETKVAVIPQGYSNGLDRRLSNQGSVLIRGRRCPILGRVMMNMTVVDVSHMKTICVEDEVVLLGQQGREEITAEELAKQIGTINYEIVTRISALLPRILV